MNIKFIVVGKLKEKYFKQGIAEYAKRLSKFCKFSIVEVPDEKAPESLSDAEMAEVKEKEGQRILDKIKEREYVFSLEILGKERSSEEFAKEIDQLATYGHSDLTFVIGGSLGLSPGFYGMNVKLPLATLHDAWIIAIIISAVLIVWLLIMLRLHHKM